MLPDLTGTITDFNKLLDKFTAGPAAPFVNQAKSEMARRLGFDPLKPAEWGKIGIDPAKGLALALWPGEVIVVAGLSDQSVFENEVKKRMKELVAADQVSTQSVDGQSITTIGTKLGDRVVPQLHYVPKGGYVLLAGAAKDTQRLAAAAAQKPEQSMAKSQWYLDLRKQVAKDADLLVMINGLAAQPILDKREPETAKVLRNGLVLAWSLAPSGIMGEAFLGLDPETSKKFDGFVSGVKDVHLEKYLPADAVLALKLRANAGKLLEAVLAGDPQAKAELDTALAQAKEQLGVDLRAGTVDNLAGNAVLGISLGKPQAVSQAIASQGQGNLGEVFGLVFWLQLKDGPAFTKLLNQALDAAGDRLPANRSQVGDIQVLSFPEKNGIQANILHTRDLLGLCLGKECLKTISPLLKGKGSPLSAELSQEARKLFEQESIFVGTLKFGKLLDVLSGLDVSSMGEGGMRVKVVLDMVIGAVKNLREATAVIKKVPGGVAFQGHLQIQ